MPIYVLLFTKKTLLYYIQHTINLESTVAILFELRRLYIVEVLLLKTPPLLLSAKRSPTFCPRDLRGYF